MSGIRDGRVLPRIKREASPKSVAFSPLAVYRRLAVREIPPPVDYKQSLFPLRDSRGKQTSEQARNRLPR